MIKYEKFYWSKFGDNFNAKFALNTLMLTCNNAHNININTDPIALKILDCNQDLEFLRIAGWEIKINEVLAHNDRKGFQITLLKPIANSDDKA